MASDARRGAYAPLKSSESGPSERRELPDYFGDEYKYSAPAAPREKHRGMHPILGSPSVSMSSSVSRDSIDDDPLTTMLSMFSQDSGRDLIAADKPKTLHALKMGISTTRFDIGAGTRRLLNDRTSMKRSTVTRKTVTASYRERDPGSPPIQYQSAFPGHSGFRGVDSSSSVIPLAMPAPFTEPSTDSTATLSSPRSKTTKSMSDRAIHPGKRRHTSSKRSKKTMRRMAKRKEKAWQEMYTGGQRMQRSRAGRGGLTGTSLASLGLDPAVGVSISLDPAADSRVSESMSTDPLSLTRLAGSQSRLSPSPISPTAGRSSFRPSGIAVVSREEVERLSPKRKIAMESVAGAGASSDGSSDSEHSDADEDGDDWCVFGLEWEQERVLWNPYLLRKGRLNIFQISPEEMIGYWPVGDTVRYYLPQLQKDEKKSEHYRRIEDFRSKHFIWFFDKEEEAVTKVTDDGGMSEDVARLGTITDVGAASAAGGEGIPDDPYALESDPWLDVRTLLSGKPKEGAAKDAALPTGFGTGGDVRLEDMKSLTEYLSSRCHGVILAIGPEDVTALPVRDVFRRLADERNYDMPVTIGYLRGHCQYGHESCLDWKSVVNVKTQQGGQERENDECLFCRRSHMKVKVDELPWLQAGSVEHKTERTKLCGLCTVDALFEMEDISKLNLKQYLDRNLTRPEKVKELCLIHRLFSTSEKLMQTLFAELMEALKVKSGVDERRSQSRVVHIINFVTHWIDLLWTEDFPMGSESRTVLNSFVTTLHRLSFAIEADSSVDPELEPDFPGPSPMERVRTGAEDVLADVFDTASVMAVLPLRQRQTVFQSCQRLMTAYRKQYLSDKQQLLRDEVELWSRYLSKVTGDVTLMGASISPKMSVSVEAPADGGKPSSFDERQEFDRLLREKRKLLDVQQDFGELYLKQCLKRAASSGADSSTGSGRTYTLDELTIDMEEDSFTKEDRELDLPDSHRNCRYLVRISVRMAMERMDQFELNAASMPQGPRDFRSETEEDLLDSLSPVAITTKKTGFTGLFTSIFGSSSKTEERAAQLAFTRRCKVIANQLTLTMYTKFQSIRPTELLGKSWEKEDKHVHSPHVVDFIFLCESISLWAQLEIVAERPAYRAKAIESMIRIGLELKKLQNQHAMLQVYAGLDRTRHFKGAWEKIMEEPRLAEFMEIGYQLLNSSRNFEHLRGILDALTTPAIPYLGIFLKDFYMYDEKMKKSIIGRASPAQTELFWSLYKRLDDFRQAPYHILPIKQVQEFISEQLDYASRVDWIMLSKLGKRLATEER